MSRSIIAGVALCLALSPARAKASDTRYDDQSVAMRALLTTGAVAANSIPIFSAVYAKQCLPGYVLCKALLAMSSVLFAAEQVTFSGANDMNQTRAILHRGFGGDWFLTGRHINGDVQAQPWPEPTPG